MSDPEELRSLNSLISGLFLSLLYHADYGQFNNYVTSKDIFVYLLKMVCNCWRLIFNIIEKHFIEFHKIKTELYVLCFKGDFWIGGSLNEEDGTWTHSCSNTSIIFDEEIQLEFGQTPGNCLGMISKPAWKFMYPGECDALLASICEGNYPSWTVNRWNDDLDDE